MVTLIGTFSDVEYVDTHETTWNFGDNQPIAPGVLAETNADFHTTFSTLGSGEFVVEAAVAPPGDDDVGGEFSVAEHG